MIFFCNQQGIQMGLMRMKTTFAVAVVFTLHLVCVVQCLDIDLLNKQATYVDAKVGSYAVFNCPLDFPQDIEIPYILHWNKEVSEQTNSCAFDSVPTENKVKRI